MEKKKLPLMDKYPSSFYQPLFDLMKDQHGLILLSSEMSDIIEMVRRLDQSQPGPRWVKAIWGMIPDGIHSMKLVSKEDVIMRGTGLVANNAITVITFLNKSTMGIDDLPKDYEGVYYLDESSTAATLIQSRADYIREVNNRDVEGIKAAEKEEDWIVFTEWAPTIAFFDEDTRLWELIREGEFINGQFRFTTKELYELFKQQNESNG